MTQQYTPVTWQDETTSQQGTLINAERLNQMQQAHHYADGLEEVDTVPTADPGVAYHKIVYCTADNTLYRWDGTEWTRDIDDETKALLEQEIARATEAEGELAQDLADETTARETADTAMQADITAMQSGKLDKKTASPNQYQVYGVRGSSQIMINAGFSAHGVPLYGVEDELLAKMPTISLTENTVVNYGWATAQIGAEATARAEADTLLGDRITAETSAREGADTALGNRITAEETRATQAEQANAQAIANTYTKAETDTLLATKADQATTYTKTETDTLLATKANASTTYTKTEVQTYVSNALDSYAPMVRTTGNQPVLGIKRFTGRSINGGQIMTASASAPGKWFKVATMPKQAGAVSRTMLFMFDNAAYSTGWWGMFVMTFGATTILPNLKWIVKNPSWTTDTDSVAVGSSGGLWEIWLRSNATNHKAAISLIDLCTEVLNQEYSLTTIDPATETEESAPTSDTTINYISA